MNRDAYPEPADAAALLSSWWSRPVEAEVDGWEQRWPQAAAVAAALDLEHVDELAAAARSAKADDLLDEYERLFIGPGRTPCPPYESMWSAGESKLDHGHLMSAASGAVAELYRGLDLVVSRDAAELPDQVAVEWEALAVALARDDDPKAARVAATLLDEHLSVWLPLFCAAVAEHATQPFYVALASLTPSWTRALTAAHVSA